MTGIRASFFFFSFPKLLGRMRAETDSVGGKRSCMLLAFFFFLLFHVMHFDFVSATFRPFSERVHNTKVRGRGTAQWIWSLSASCIEPTSLNNTTVIYKLEKKKKAVLKIKGKQEKGFDAWKAALKTLVARTRMPKAGYDIFFNFFYVPAWSIFVGSLPWPSAS